MPYFELHSSEYRIFQIESRDEVYNSRLRELRSNNIELLKKIFDIGSRLKFVDQLRFHITHNWREEIRQGYVVSDRHFQYELNRTKTYLTLTCIDVAAGRSYKRFYEWLTNNLKKRNDADNSFINIGLNEIFGSPSLNELSTNLIEWINNVLLDRYISEYGVRCKFLEFIKDSPDWLIDWLLSSYYIYNGELDNKKLSEFYGMQPAKKLDLIANYYFFLRNKFTHTIEYIETHEDEQTYFFQSPFGKEKEESFLPRVIYEDGDDSKPILWTIGLLSNLNESDIVRTVLIIQIRQKLLNIDDDPSAIDSCLIRNEYRFLGYSFLNELTENLNTIKNWQYYNNEDFRYKYSEGRLNPLSFRFSLAFIEFHNSHFPDSKNRLYPSLFEQQNNICQKKYPSMRHVERLDLSEYIELFEQFNSELNSNKRSTSSNRKDHTQQLMKSQITRQLCSYIECIQMELSYRLDDIVF